MATDWAFEVISTFECRLFCFDKTRHVKDVMARRDVHGRSRRQEVVISTISCDSIHPGSHSRRGVDTTGGLRGGICWGATAFQAHRTFGADIDIAVGFHQAEPFFKPRVLLCAGAVISVGQMLDNFYLLLVHQGRNSTDVNGGVATGLCGAETSGCRRTTEARRCHAQAPKHARSP